MPAGQASSSRYAQEAQGAWRAANSSLQPPLDQPTAWAARSPTSALPTTTTGLQSLPTTLQNTYVDMAHFGPYIDAAMAAANIPKVPNPLPVTLKDAMSSADS